MWIELIIGLDFSYSYPSFDVCGKGLEKWGESWRGQKRQQEKNTNQGKSSRNVKSARFFSLNSIRCLALLVGGCGIHYRLPLFTHASSFEQLYLIKTWKLASSTKNYFLTEPSNMIDIWIHWIQLIINIAKNVQCFSEKQIGSYLIELSINIYWVLAWEKITFLLFLSKMSRPHSWLFFVFKPK